MRLALLSSLSLALFLSGCTDPTASDRFAPDPCDDVDCGSASCEVADEVAECVCPAAYTFDAVTLECALDILSADDGFDEPRWTLTGGSADGATGEALFAGAGCEDVGIATDIVLPDVDPGAPLVLDIAYTAGDCEVQGDCTSDASVTPYLRLDGRTLPAPDSGDGAQQVSVCLGSAFLTGESASLEFGIDSYVWFMPCAGAPYWLESVQSAEVRLAEAGECLESVGLEDEADFPELGEGGWEVIDLYPNGEWPATHGLVMDPGGDYYQVVTTSNFPNRISPHGVKLRREVSVPQSATGLAIAVDMQTSIDMEWGLRLGDEDGLFIAQTGWVDAPPSTRRLFCVPAWARGIITELSLTLGLSEESVHESGRTGTFELHGVQFVDEPSCGDGSLVNGDFEGTAPSWWDAHRPTNDDKPTFTIESEPDGPSGTNQFARLAVEKDCSGAGIRTHALLPAGTNYLRFRYRTAPGQSESGEVEYGPISHNLTPSDTWSDVSLCLPILPEKDGLSILFVQSSGGSCSNLSADRLEIDDVELVEGAPCTPPVPVPVP